MTGVDADDYWDCVSWTYFGRGYADVDSVDGDADVIYFLAVDIEDCSGAGSYD